MFNLYQLTLLSDDIKKEIDNLNYQLDGLPDKCDLRETLQKKLDDRVKIYDIIEEQFIMVGPA